MSAEGNPDRRADARPELLVSDRADWALFDAIAIHLSASLQGHWTNRLDGVDQRYWDLACADGILTLHLDSFAGISILHRDQSIGPEEAARLLARVNAALGSFVPPS